MSARTAVSKRELIGGNSMRMLRLFPALLVTLIVMSGGATFGATTGFVGCSNTVNLAEGYFRHNGDGWHPSDIAGYGGGSLRQWARVQSPRDSRWDVFEQALRANPDTERIVWQICLVEAEVPTIDRPIVSNETFLDALEVRDEILRVYLEETGLPLLELYVIGLPHFTDTCPKAGGHGNNFLTSITAIVADLVGETLLPLTGLLEGRLPDIGPDEVSEPDGCHRNRAAKIEAGEWLFNAIPFPLEPR